jgi:hypothetical protein
MFAILPVAKKEGRLIEAASFIRDESCLRIRGASHRADQRQKHDCAEEGGDERANREARASVDTEQAEQPAADHRAEDTDHDVPNQAKPATAHYFTCGPPGNCTDH